MFIPVIRCEEEDLYFIVVECIQCCLVSASPSACLFGKHLPPPEARCNPCIEGKRQRCLQPTADQTYNGSSITSDTTRGKIASIQSKAFSAQADAGGGLTAFGLGGC